MTAERRILVVDDSTAVREVIRRTLMKAGYLVDAAPNGAEALSLIKDGLTPSLVVVDVMMPEMGGMELCRVLRASRMYKDVAILLMTARDTDRLAGLVEKARAEGALAKPFAPKELREAVNRLLCEAPSDL